MSPTVAAKSIADILEDAATLIEPEGAWTQHVSATDAQGCPTFATAQDAACWCAYGAIVSVGGRNQREAVWLADEAVAERVGSIIKFNDARGRKQREVVAKLREAATLAREQGK